MRYYDSAKPSPFVKISTFSENGALVMKVEDNGVGIDPKHQPKVFEMFFRASKLSQGTGLGLYIVKEAVKVLNGTVEMTSTLHKGTQFLIKIPVQS